MCIRDSISFDPSAAHFLGEVAPSSSFVSELYVQTIARVFIVSHIHKYINCKHTPIYIMYDSKGAHSASVTSKIASMQPALSRLANIVDCLSAEFFNIKHE